MCWSIGNRVDVAVGPPPGVDALVQTDLLTDLDSMMGGGNHGLGSHDAVAVVDFLKHVEPRVAAVLEENATSTVRLPFTGACVAWKEWLSQWMDGYIDGLSSALSDSIRLVDDAIAGARACKHKYKSIWRIGIGAGRRDLHPDAVPQCLHSLNLPRAHSSAKAKEVAVRVLLYTERLVRVRGHWLTH